MEEFLILPGCDDTNRGDQALIWETVALAQKAGYQGTFYMLADEEKAVQSRRKGIQRIDYILPHPSAHFQETNNISYSKLLKIKWALAALFDLVKYLPLLSPMMRGMFLQFYSPKIKASIAHYQRASASFVKGGGFLHACGGFTETYKIFYFLYHILLAQSFGQAVYVMPNSFGPFQAPGVAKMLRHALSRCKVVMTREHISHEALRRECGFQAVESIDLAFMLKADESFDAETALRKQGVPLKSERCVAITMRPYRFPGAANADQLYENYKKELARFICWLSQEGYYPVLIEHVSCNLEHENDMTCIRQVEKMIGGTCRYSVFSAPELSCEEMKRVYSCFDYTVGTRFHSVIFSLSEGVPSMALAYGGNKGTGIMQDLGLENYSMKISELSFESMMEKFSALVRNEAAVKETIESFKKSLPEHENHIINLIRKDA